MQQLGRYRIVAELGKGNMGTVYRGHDPAIGREVALKTIDLTGFTDQAKEGYCRRFFDEAKAAGTLAHPGIVTVFDAGVDEALRVPYIVMQLIEGESLQHAIEAAGGPFHPARAYDIAIQVAAALDYAHARGVVHRDVKPANVSVTPEGRAVLTDFGVAQFRRSREHDAREVPGTLAYMAPERIQGQRADGRADLFSLGVMLYRLLTGKKPFSGEPDKMMFRIVHREPAAPSSRNRVLGKEADAFIAKALAKSPDDRYQNGREFAEALRPLLERARAASPAQGWRAAPVLYGAIAALIVVAAWLALTR